MKKFVTLLLCFFVGWNTAFAHGGHKVSFSKPDAAAANAIIWISVAIVLVTLFLSIKYLVRPKENDPNHIKNVVRDEGF